MEASATLDVSGGAFFLQGALYVSGALFCETMLIDGGGSASLVNYGTIECLELEAQSDDVHNAGYITVVDNMLLTGVFDNTITGEFDVYDMQGSGSYLNHGYAVVRTELFQGRIHNVGTLLVQVSGTSAHVVSIVNEGDLILQTMDLDTLINDGVTDAYNLTIGRWYQGAGQMRVVPSGGDLWIDEGATVTVNAPGWIHVLDGDLDNAGTMTGDGQVCVAEFTSNSGSIEGTLDICDGSPTTSLPPYLDQNTGAVEAGVIFCLNGACSTPVLEHFALNAALVLLPGLDQALLTGLPPNVLVEVVAPTGALTMSHSVVSSDRLAFDLTDMAFGLYRVVLIGEAGRRVLPMVVAR